MTEVTAEAVHALISWHGCCASTLGTAGGCSALAFPQTASCIPPTPTRQQRLSATPVAGRAARWAARAPRGVADRDGLSRSPGNERPGQTPTLSRRARPMGPPTAHAVQRIWTMGSPGKTPAGPPRAPGGVADREGLPEDLKDERPGQAADDAAHQVGQQHGQHGRARQVRRLPVAQQRGRRAGDAADEVAGDQAGHHAAVVGARPRREREDGQLRVRARGGFRVGSCAWAAAVRASFESSVFGALGCGRTSFRPRAAQQQAQRHAAGEGGGQRRRREPVLLLRLRLRFACAWRRGGRALAAPWYTGWPCSSRSGPCRTRFPRPAAAPPPGRSAGSTCARRPLCRNNHTHRRCYISHTHRPADDRPGKSKRIVYQPAQ